VNEAITPATTPTSPTDALMAGYLSYLVERHLPRNLHRGRFVASGDESSESIHTRSKNPWHENYWTIERTASVE